MSWHLVAGLTLALVPIVLAPGTSAVLVAQYAATAGRREVLAVMLGTATGLFVHAGLAALGLSALVAASATALAVVRVVGAVYLVGLGLWLVVTRPPRPAATTAPARRNVFLQALFGNVANPKAAMVYLTLPVQFLAPGESAAAAAFLLAGLHVLLLTPWLTLWAVAVRSAGRSRRLRGFTGGVRRAGGLLLVALGVRSALAH
ncbi:threonine/homoserine/homoserine lactone efflux protein [Stackebrandtia albiflava]|uniref:Threonine/homoserine/homoserine lactone efflux protein n=1 Tax=Stackebrandtia albiflava TaxID=406432 RepID=A0A562VAF1_9ACTN|nr:LysE family translocator [Stackebrandtia albiflava]TWJ14828.1 threonine/homoserine/homoserine lactone efflux protein [Stackebrandtia albiflava]